jgi:hypothetical protein
MIALVYLMGSGDVLLGQDAITRDKPPDKTGVANPAAEDDTSEPKGQELVYAARISLDRAQMQVEDRFVNLAAGMTTHARRSAHGLLQQNRLI